MTAENFGYGQQTPWDSSDEYNTIEFIFRQLAARNVTMKIARVEAVHPGATDLDPVTVDVLPLVNQVDGNGNVVPHETVYGIPVFRLQGGQCAVVLVPVVGDVGMILAADRDISNAKANPGDQVTPGSRRMFDLADGVYLGGVLNAAPTCYVKMTAGGDLKVADANGNVLETSPTGFAIVTAPGGDLTVNGISVTLHTHAVTAAPGETGPPVG